MVLPTVLLKIAAHCLLTGYRAARKLTRNHGFLHKKVHLSSSSSWPNVTKCPLVGREDQTLLCDFHGTLLGTASPFPFFMLVAFEGGGLLRALLLLLSSPILWALGQNGEAGLRIMAFITFCGLRRKDMELVARAVLPKFFLESLHLHAYEVLASSGRKVVVTTLPRVMVEGFLREYLSVDRVVAPELQMAKGGARFTGFFSCFGLVAMRQKALMDIFGEVKADVGLVSPSYPHDHLLLPYCKEAYVVTNQEEPTTGKSCAGPSTVLPRHRYPRLLIFHDGRLALLPTPPAILAFFVFLPMGILLSVVRISIGIFLPYKLSFSVCALTGVHFRVGGRPPPPTGPADAASGDAKGVMYVCTHRTLLDPIMLSAALQRPVPAVTYSLSRTSEMISPIKAVRLTRNRERDATTIRNLLREGDLAVCPEGTTCREPYLLRFSPLFAELAGEMEPVAVNARAGMLYGTTASGHKWLDPVVFMMNPTPAYKVVFLGRVPPEMTRAGGWSGAEVANRIQRQLGDALGFECTGLTRKDKYMMLAGNDGMVASSGGRGPARREACQIDT